jgi:hypothetical protein
MTIQSYEQALKLYASRPDMNFDRDVRLHAKFGYVVLSVDFFAMIRPVCSDWKPRHLQNIRRIARPRYANCWFVWLLCGSLKEAVKHLPYHLPWFGFSQRGQEVRFVDAEKVLAKIG